MQITKFIKYLSCVFLIFLIILIIKNECTAGLLKKSNYGIPALIEKGEVKDLYIGSSMFRQGIDIEVLENENRDAYILAYNGNQPFMEYFELKKLIDNNVKIENLYIDLYVYSAYSKPDISDEKFLLELSFNEKYELYKCVSADGFDFKLLWQMFVGANNELLFTWPISYPIVNAQFEAGGTLLKPEGSTKEKLDSLKDIPIDTEIDQTQIEAIAHIVNLCRQKNIQLYFIESPKYIKIADDEEYKEALEIYTNKLEDMNAKYFLAEDIVQKQDMINPRYYSDMIHLSYDGRKNFTKKLTEKIK